LAAAIGDYPLMQPRRRIGFYVVLLIVVAGITGGCAGSRSQEVPAARSFAAADAEAVFKAAYRVIADRFIEPVSSESVAAVALAGLCDIDASLAVGRVGDAVNLSMGGKQVATFPAPEARDADGWAKLTVRLWRAARMVSPRLAAAADEDVYEAVLDRAMQALDSSSTYATTLEARRNRQRRDGYNGVGVRIADGGPTIIEVTGRSPAERSGCASATYCRRSTGVQWPGFPPRRSMDGCRRTLPGWSVYPCVAPNARCGSPSSGVTSFRRRSA
jgi:hypothetical protein